MCENQYSKPSKDRPNKITCQTHNKTLYVSDAYLLNLKALGKYLGKLPPRLEDYINELKRKSSESQTAVEFISSRLAILLVFTGR